MRVKKLRFAALALMSALTALPSASWAESLNQALASAYRNSGLLDQQRALLRADDEDLAIAVAATRPVFTYALVGRWTHNEIGGIVTDTNTLTASLGASYTLYDAGAGQMGIELAHENVLLARETLKGVEANVLLRAVSAFLDVRSAHETALLRANNVRLITQELRAARDRFEVGEITQTDVSAAEAALAAAKSGEAAARGSLMVAREEYNAAIGHFPDGLEVPPAVPFSVTSLEAAKATARSRHPDVLAAQRAVTVADLAGKIAHTSMKPSVTADAGLSHTIQTGADRTTAQVSVTLGGVIYAGGKLSATYRKALAQAEATRAALHMSVIAVQQDVGNAWAQLAIATASLEATDQQIRASRVALRGAREEAQLGARTTLEVLSFEQDLLDAEAARITAQSNQYLAIYALMSSMGMLSVEQLHLGVDVYNPDAYHNAVKGAPVVLVSPQGERLDALFETLGRQ